MKLQKYYAPSIIPSNEGALYLAIDVDPLIEAKDKEIKKQAETIEHLTRYQLWSHGEIDQLQSKLDESISPVIESYQEALDQQKERILELQAEIERLRDLVEVYVPKTELPK